VLAMSVKSRAKKLSEIDESSACVLRFEPDRLATFVTSFNASDVSSYRVVGTKGQIHLDPAYEYAQGLGYELILDGKKTKKTAGKHDQFAPELLYFSDCIQNGWKPEPSGEEGMQDIRIVEALYRSARTGRAVRLPSIRRHRRPDSSQRIHRPGVRKPRLVKAASASQ
jgi:glucose-fructose oxidoreductase